MIPPSPLRRNRDFVLLLTGRLFSTLGSQVTAIKISDAVGRLKTVRPDGTMIRTAQALGISIGN